jgi:nucleoside diphosphate kinase
MSLKIHDLNREQVEKLVVEHEMQPVFVGQNPYIASGPNHEILVSLMPNGLYQVELLDKKQMEESLQQTIKAFKEYAAAIKS